MLDLVQTAKQEGPTKMASTTEHKPRVYSFTRQAKPEPSVKVYALPPELVAALDMEWEYHKTHPDYVSVTRASDESDGKRLAAYARAWGLSRQGEKVTVRKLPNRPSDHELDVRLEMTKFDPNAPKRGRKPNSGKTE